MGNPKLRGQTLAKMNTATTPSFSFLPILFPVFFFPAGSNAAAAPSGNERKILASVLVLEAADQGAWGMWAVLHVINNRAGGDLEHAIGDHIFLREDGRWGQAVLDDSTSVLPPVVPQPTRKDVIE